MPISLRSVRLVKVILPTRWARRKRRNSHLWYRRKKESRVKFRGGTSFLGVGRRQMNIIMYEGIYLYFACNTTWRPYEADCGRQNVIAKHSLYFTGSVRSLECIWIVHFIQIFVCCLEFPSNWTWVSALLTMLLLGLLTHLACRLTWKEWWRGHSLCCLSIVSL